eukprot:s424_g30.t3
MMPVANQNVDGSNQRSGVRRVVDRVSVDCAAMAMVLWESNLNSLLPPQKPREVGGDQELAPAFPIDDRLSVGGESLLPDEDEMCRRARSDTGESLETRQSYFSNSMPTRASVNAPPNRILHNRNKVLVENMMKELCTLSGRRRLVREVASRRQAVPDEEPKKPVSPQKQGWNFAGPWFSFIPRTPPGGPLPGTPTGLPIPGTPTRLFQQVGVSIPGTPTGSFRQVGVPIPSTPTGPIRHGAARRVGPAEPFRPRTPGWHDTWALPQTPGAAFQGGNPGTPTSPFWGGTSSGSIPQTPVAAYRGGTPGVPIPQTPAAAFRGGIPSIPQTPAEAFGRLTPGTPAAPVQPMWAWGGTPHGAIPQTPQPVGAAFWGGNPHGAIPQTPAFWGGTPSGAPPAMAFW